MSLLRTTGTSPIYQIPTEILDLIISSVNIRQLATLRQVCSHWRCIVDKPSRWKKVTLFSSSSNTIPIAKTTFHYLWSLDSLRYLLNPHLRHIRSVTLSGVRDSNIRFILTHCPLLENLEIISWNTLSNHALALPDTTDHHLKLRRFTITGGVDQFLAIDAKSLAQFILHCPYIHHLSIFHCRLCIHPDYFLEQIQSQQNASCLNTLTTLFLQSVEQPWSQYHAEQLLVLFPRLQRLRLDSKSSTIFMTRQPDTGFRCSTIKFY